VRENFTNVRMTLSMYDFT